MLLSLVSVMTLKCDSKRITYNIKEKYSLFLIWTFWNCECLILDIEEFWNPLLLVCFSSHSSSPAVNKQYFAEWLPVDLKNNNQVISRKFQARVKVKVQQLSRFRKVKSHFLKIFPYSKIKVERSRETCYLLSKSLYVYKAQILSNLNNVWGSRYPAFTAGCIKSVF